MNLIRRFILIILGLLGLLGLKWLFDPDISDDPEIMEKQTELYKTQAKTLKEEDKLEES